jgi:hypothetical protein
MERNDNSGGLSFIALILALMVAGLAILANL